MAGFTPVGKNLFLRTFFGEDAPPEHLYLGIYKNSGELPPATTLNEVIEPVGSGYARKDLLRGEWVITETVAGYAVQVFLAEGGAWGDCYGYFLATSLDNLGQLLASNAFPDGSKNILQGDRIGVELQVTAV